VTERLKQARESRGLSHRQIAEVAKVSSRVIAAIENQRFDIVPGSVYRRSLIRLFAAEVGLPPEETLRAFLDEHPDDLALPAGSMPAEAEPRRWFGAWRRALTMIGAVVPLLVGIAYFGRPAPPRRVPAAVSMASRQAGTWQPDIVPAGGFSEAPPPAARPVAMLITISGRCDLRVSADGSLVVGRRFEAGESFRVAFSDAIEIDGTDAGAVQYSLNGRVGRMLGAAGATFSTRLGRDDYPLLLSER
jgi:transcriptional regulator with XRE-family HTH domain